MSIDHAVQTTTTTTMLCIQRISFYTTTGRPALSIFLVVCAATELCRRVCHENEVRLPRRHVRARTPLRFAVRRVKFNNHCAHQQTPTGRARRAAFTRILPPAAAVPPPPHLLCITGFNRRFMVVPVDAGSVSPCEDRKPRPGSSRLPLYRARRQNQAAVAVAAAAAAANHSSLRD